MKLLLLSDLHLTWHNPVCRLDNLIETQFDKLRFVLDYAERNNLTICQAGDCFDSPRSYYLLEKVMELLRKYKVNIYAVFGGKRHDTYLYSNETRAATNLGILERSGLVKILDKKPVPLVGSNLENLIHVYGASYGEELPEVKYKGKFNILVIHAPITDSSIIGGMDADDFLLTNSDYDLILCGDIHRKFAMSCKSKKGLRWIVNTGPMLRDSADLYNFDHEPCFAIFDTDSRSIEWAVIPHKAAEEVLSRNHLDRKADTVAMLDDFIGAIDTGVEFTADLVENMFLFMKENKAELGDESVGILTEMINRKEG
jgi:DNA repair exonuclease SbcCD nuclease subunit